MNDRHSAVQDRPMSAGKRLWLLPILVLITSCVTMHGNYRVRAVDPQGRDLTPNLVLTAQGRGIYTVRNALCASHPGAIVLIEDAKTGQALESESPYQCRGKKS